MSKNKDPTPYELFQNDLKEKKTPDEKLEAIVVFMRESLAQKGVPRFRDFWEARKVFHDVFKECKDALVKSKMWEQLGEMTQEARQIKEILDEQSTFAIEQIELAIKALAKDVGEEKSGKGERLSIPQECKTLLRKSSLYSELQTKIHFFSIELDRLKELRNEVINTEMRIKYKNRLLKELSSVGDRFIPKRKELVAKVSEEFLDDVQSFVYRNFGDSERRLPPHVLRKEIQGFQSMAKVVALNSKAFKEVRDELSKCWEQLKKWGDEKKAEYEQNKDVYDKNLEEITPEVEKYLQLASDVDKGNRTQIDAEHEKIVKKLRETKLDGKKRHGFFKQVDSAHEKWIADKSGIDEKKKKAKKKEFEDRVSRYRNELALVEKKSVTELEKLVLELEDESGEIFESMLNELKMSLLKKRAQESSGSDEVETLLEEWTSVEVMMRKKLEKLRKSAGKSGFDFEQAMLYREQIDETKKCLEEAEEAIEGLQSKL
jgi:hypothetical protein